MGHSAASSCLPAVHPVAVAVALVLGTATPGYAATITVDAAEVAVNSNGLCSLIEAVANANSGGIHADCSAGSSSGTDTLQLAAGSVYTLSAADSIADGPNGVPTVSSRIVVNGNGAIVERSNAFATPEFRLWHVSEGGSLTLNELTLRNGLVAATTGGSEVSIAGGAVLSRGQLTLNESTVVNNRAQYGGGIETFNGVTTLSKCTVAGNSATYGGGMYNFGRSTASIEDTTISGNTATGTGGGIMNSESTVTLINSTVSGNNADKGGGVYNYTVDSNLTLTNSTVSNNSANEGSSVFNLTGNTVNTVNSIVANGDAEGGDECAGTANPVINGTITGSLFEDASCDGDADGDPGLGPLADNGGATQTHALLDGSAAIDTGSNAECPATDQRGIDRSDGLCDIGAFELPASGETSFFQDDFEG